MNLATALELAAHRYPDALAVVTPQGRFTYREWDSRINSVALGLIDLGIRPGDRVAVCTGNGEPPASMYFAIHRAGAVAVMLNARWKHGDIAYALIESRAAAILLDGGTEGEVLKAVHSSGRSVTCISSAAGEHQGPITFAELAGKPTDTVPDVERPDSGLGTVLYTSGTTGRPKGVCRSPRSDYYAALAIIMEHHWERYERILAVMPLYHTMGLHTLISLVLLNGTAIMSPSAAAKECTRYLEDERVTALYLVPTIFHDIVSWIEERGKKVRVRKLAFAGAPMSEKLVGRCVNVFNPEIFVNQYGCTEMLAISTNARLDRKPASAGRPALHTRMRIVDTDRSRQGAGEGTLPPGEIGEVIVEASASPQAFTGYLNNPEATAKAVECGWYYTGDLGFLDEEGDLFLVGRVDDMIISGGENIYPPEVESVLLGHPGVKEAVVVGLPDERWGESVAAFIVRASPELEENELVEYCLKCPQLPRFKRPRSYIFVREIPKSPTGKILRSRLKSGDCTPYY